MRHVWSGLHDGCAVCMPPPPVSLDIIGAVRRTAPGAPRKAREGKDKGAPKSPSKSTKKSGTSNTVFRDSRAGRGGRPRVSAEEQKRKVRERQRRLRQGGKAA